MISANGGLPAHRYTPQVTPRWPRGSEPASWVDIMLIVRMVKMENNPLFRNQRVNIVLGGA